MCKHHYYLKSYLSENNLEHERNTEQKITLHYFNYMKMANPGKNGASESELMALQACLTLPGV